MNEHEFLQAFENGTLQNFPHHDHVWMAWLYLRREGWERGSACIADGIRHLADIKGASNKYHHTLTLFWARMAYSAIQQTPNEDNFERFLEQNPHLLNIKLTDEYYTSALLWSDSARHTWTPPDLKPMREL